MFTTKLSMSSRRPRPTYNLVAPLALAVLGVIAASTEPALAGDSCSGSCRWRWPTRLWRFWAADTGSFASFASAVRATA